MSTLSFLRLTCCERGRFLTEATGLCITREAFLQSSKGIGEQQHTHTYTHTHAHDCTIPAIFRLCSSSSLIAIVLTAGFLDFIDVLLDIAVVMLDFVAGLLDFIAWLLMTSLLRCWTLLLVCWTLLL